jgi:hypothetical protein
MIGGRLADNGCFGSSLETETDEAWCAKGDIVYFCPLLG